MPYRFHLQLLLRSNILLSYPYQRRRILRYLQTQAFLTSALVSDQSYTRQELFNRHVARNFTYSWCVYVQNRFQFYSPRTSILTLLRALNGIEDGNSTLKSVLIAAVNALEYPLGKFMDRVL